MAAASFLCFPAQAMNSISIMVDSSLSVPLAEIARHYSRERQVVVNTSFASSKEQEKQITEGGAADILITPNQTWIDQLKNRGLVDVHSQIEVAQNRLVLAGPADNDLHIQWEKKFPSPALLAGLNNGAGFILADPDNFREGIAGKQALQHLDKEGVLDAYTIYSKDVKQMFEMVEKHKACGLFLYSSTIGKGGIRVVDFIPQTAYDPIYYYSVVLAGDDMAEARKFLDYLSSFEAKMVFKKNGFVVKESLSDE